MDSQVTLVGEVAQLGASLGRQVDAIEAALSGSGREDPATQLAEHRELVRQLGALRDRVTRARAEIGDRRELRAELATLLFFAGTLRTDAESLRARLREEIEGLAREQRALRLERERLTAEQERLVAEREEALRRRDALQAKIVQTAEGMADRGECRRTVPVIALDDGVTVCSMGVGTPKRPFRIRQFWLVTLTDARDDVLVRRT